MIPQGCTAEANIILKVSCNSTIKNYLKSKKQAKLSSEQRKQGSKFPSFFLMPDGAGLSHRRGLAGASAPRKTRPRASSPSPQPRIYTTSAEKYGASVPPLSPLFFAILNPQTPQRELRSALLRWPPQMPRSWDCEVRVSLGLDDVTWKSVLRIHPCCAISWGVHLFQGCILFHHRAIRPASLVSLFVRQHSLGLFPHLGYYQQCSEGRGWCLYLEVLISRLWAQT